MSKRGRYLGGHSQGRIEGFTGIGGPGRRLGFKRGLLDFAIQEWNSRPSDRNDGLSQQPTAKAKTENSPQALIRTVTPNELDEAVAEMKRRWGLD